jgi:DNA-binding transcriptional LysR family regulator
MNTIDSGVDLRALRALVAIADGGSFRSAATRLGYSQSAISHRIAALERSLGAALFDRPGGRGGVSLTPDGQAAYAHARRAIAAVEALEAEVGPRASDGRATLRVGVFQSAAAELLPAALRAFRRDWPRVEVVLSENDRLERISERIARGRLDLAFARNATSDDRVDAIPLMDDPLVILTRRDSPLVTLKAPTFDVLDGAEVVAWTRRWPMQLELEAAWRRRAISPRVVFRTEDNLALQRLVAAGLGDACIGRVAAQHAIDPALTWVEPAESLIDRRIVLLAPRTREPSAAALTLIAAIKAHLRG